jgi:PAS domain S-box-containing protein
VSYLSTQTDDPQTLRKRIAELELENARLRALPAAPAGIESYRTQFGLSPVPSFVHFENRIIYVNHALLELLGAKSEDQILGKSPLAIIHPDFHAVVHDRIGSLVEANRPLTPIVEDYLRVDGATVPVLATAWLIPYRDVHAIHVSLQNLSQLKSTERRLQASLDLIDSIIEGIPDPIFVKDLNGRYVLANAATARAVGIPQSEIIGKTDPDFITPPFLNAILAVDRRVITTGTTEVLEELILERGEVKTYLATKSAWRDATGQIAGLLGVARDITDRKVAEQELGRNRDRLELALRAGQMGTWDYDALTDTLLWSENHFRLFGLEPGSCVPSSSLFVDRMHPSDRDAVDKLIRDVMENPRDYSVQYRVIWPDKTIHWLEARGRVTVRNGKASGTIGVVTDITDQKRKDERLREAAKLESLGILAGGIAHDFNNLLTGIVGNASLILEVAPRSSQAAELAKSVVNAGERAANLTRQMLAYSGRGHFVIEPVNLSEEVAAITDLLKASIPKHVTLRLDLAASLPQVEADRGQIQQVIMNLVLNAAEALCLEGGTVKVRTSVRHVTEELESGNMSIEKLSPGEYVVIDVEDDGSGMAQEVKERIFEPFFTTKFTGRGLGLAAVLGIVRGHRGMIRVESAPTEGTTFTVLLPASGAGRQAGRMETAQKPARPGGETILIVDDEEVVRSVAVAVLERRGYRTITANNGIEAISIFKDRADEIAVVLLDLMMPVMGGVEALKHLRQICSNTVFIATSGYPETDALKQFGTRINGYIQKPYSARNLVKLVGDLLEQRSTTSQPR